MKDPILQRTFRIELTYEETKALLIKAGRVGLTPERLIGEFITSLISSPTENGNSDIEKANEWYNACWFNEDFEYSSFLQYVLDKGLYDDVIDIIAEIENKSAIMGFMKDISLSPESKLVQTEYSHMCKRIEECHNALIELFLDYCRLNSSHKTYTEEMQTVKEFSCDLKRSRRCCRSL